MEHPILLKSVRVVDAGGAWHNRVVDVLLEQGQIADIQPQLNAPNARELHVPGSVLSSGWVDGQAHFREPGEETKEGVAQGLMAASQGGFTAVAILPSTRPCVDHAGAVRNLLATSQRANQSGTPAVALPLACITEQAQGKQLAEMHDLSEAGAVAFHDDAPQDRVGLLQRALTYGEAHGKSIVDVPLDRDLNAGGLMHEGLVSTEMGLIGIPSEAETLRVARDLDLLRYAGGRLHLSPLTTAEGVELVRQAKAQGLAVTCGTTALHLAYCDEDLRGFVGTLRVGSPFRSASDRDALRRGVLDGTVDAVVSDHRPEDLEHHDVEFMLSPEGVASLPSAFGLALTGLLQSSSTPDKAIDALVRAFTTGPEKVLSLGSAHIEAGAKVNLTWFHPELPHRPHNASRGTNLPPVPGGTLGQVLGVFREDRLWVAST
jgi:dihydroorotase